MTQERFEQIEGLYHAARGGTPEQRAALLEHADPELRREVESLLEERSSGEFPALPQDFAITGLAAGACLGPYRIQDKLGEGGMGEVFRAVDTRLHRAVAIKVMRQQFSARFEREARAIAALNHSNICTLYDVGPNYLVMELIEGETVAARLKSAPLPLKTVLLYSSQILAALAEAHGKGVVHRDLKPANIMISKSGIKVLDFGLAKSRHDETVTASHAVMGTPAYMAPEQREGKPADARSDIYSFGCLLFEMLTGARVGPLRRRLPSRKLEAIVVRCMDADPARRWQSAAALERELAGVTVAGKRWKSVIAAALGLLFLLAGYLYLRQTPKLGARGAIVLGEFENRTGDAVFEQTLRRGLAAQLEQSPFLTLVSDDRIQQVLRFMNRPAETRLTPQIAREICERTGGAAVLEGSIAGLGSGYVLWLRASNCGTGDVFAQEQAQAVTKEEVLNALSRIVVQIRKRLGESLATIEQHSIPLAQATTPSLEALKAYSAGESAHFAHGGPAAIPHLLRAIAIDPQFAMAYGDLSIVYWNMGQTGLAAQYTRKAWELRDRVTDRERRWILFLYDRQVTGNLPTELQNLESWVQMYPNDWRPWAVLAGWGTQGTGQYERGLQAAQEALRLNPDNSFSYIGAIHNFLLDRFAESAEILRRAAERKLEIPEFLITRYYLAFLKGNQAEIEREIERARGEHIGDAMSHNQAMVLARSGRMRQARSMWESAIATAQQAGNRGSAALYRAAEAVCEAHFGNKAAARQRSRAALDLAKGRDVEYAAAFALALSDDLAGSQRLAADLEKQFPEDTPVQFEYLPTLRALSALARHAPLEAVDRLQTSLAYDFALPGTGFAGKFGGLYPSYVRGQAYLQAKQSREAATEFQKVLDHRGLVFADPVGVLAHLQLARAWVASGDTAKARNAYQNFLNLWKDADADLPVLQQARAEYARLR